MSLERLSGNSATSFTTGLLPLIWPLLLTKTSSATLLMSVCLCHPCGVIEEIYTENICFLFWTALVSDADQMQYLIKNDSWLLTQAEMEVSQQLIDDSSLDFNTHADTLTHHYSQVYPRHDCKQSHTTGLSVFLPFLNCIILWLATASRGRTRYCLLSVWAERRQLTHMIKKTEAAPEASIFSVNLSTIATDHFFLMVLLVFTSCPNLIHIYSPCGNSVLLNDDTVTLI